MALVIYPFQQNVEWNFVNINKSFYIFIIEFSIEKIILL